MKSKIITVASLFVFVSILSVQAQTSNKNDLANKKKEVDARIEEMFQRQEQIETRKEEKVNFIKSILLRFKKVEVESLKVKTLKNFDVAVRNLDNLYKRIESRLEKIEMGGNDISESNLLLEKAEISIELAKTEYQKLSDVIPNNFDKDSKKEIKENVKEQTKITKEAIKVALSSITETIASIKGPDNKEELDSISSTTESIKQDE